MASSYDVTIELYQHHLIERHTHAVGTAYMLWMLLMHLMYCIFVVVTLYTSAVSQI